MSPRARHLLGILVSLALFAIAVWAIRKGLDGHRPGEILRSIAMLPARHVAAALFFAAANILLAVGVDAFATRHAGRPMRYARIMIPSFIGATFQRNAGVFGGTAVRLRLYSNLGFSPVQTGKLMLSLFLAFGVAFMALTGLALLRSPDEFPGLDLLPSWPEAAGFVLVAASAGFLWLCARGVPVRCFRWRMAFPPFSSALPQILLAMGDWIAGAAILFVLLPPAFRISFPLFLSAFMIAHSLGTASNAPGGLGVFDATILEFLPAANPADILASLLAYRGIYYFLPLLLASLLLGVRELRSKRGGLPDVVHPAETIASALTERKGG